MNDQKTREIEFVPLNIAVMTISDSRTESEDTSGNILADRVVSTGHQLVARTIVVDNRYAIRSVISKWIEDTDIHAIVTTGGTGLTGRDITPEAIRPLFDKEIDGFGELFRYISFQKINTSSLQSRALSGLANGTPIFCLPGSPGACKDGWDGIIVHQLDRRHRPCNLAEIMPRFLEH